MNDIDQKVLNFYEKLPFNIYGDIDKACENIEKFDLKKVYPFLLKPVSKSETIIDVGCGGGWLVNSIAHKFKKDIHGIDFNPVAIDFAKKVSKKLNNKVSYEVKNIFDYKPVLKFDLILSMGVLHHTHDCLLALDKICKFGKKNSMIYVGLYHKEGRRPFLEFVETIKNLPEELLLLPGHDYLYNNISFLESLYKNSSEIPEELSDLATSYKPEKLSPLFDLSFEKKYNPFLRIDEFSFLDYLKKKDLFKDEKIEFRFRLLRQLRDEH